MSPTPSMGPMVRRIPATATLMLLIVGIALSAAACGGGSTPEAADGARITDPARVPSSTPIQNPVLYRIQGNQVTLVGEEGSAQLTPAAGNTPTGRSNYTIVPGDTCFGIAADNNITLAIFTSANPNVDCNNLQAGDVVIIPGGSGGSGGSATPAPTQGSGSGQTYTVGAGETCSDIASSYGVSVAAIIALNGLDSNCSLQVGQVVRIP
jgi:LysM repeat protein